MLPNEKFVEISEHCDIAVDRNDLSNNNISYFNGSYKEFFHKFLLTNTPCIIPNAAEKWECFSSWVTAGKPNVDYMSSKYGTANVPVANCNEKYFNSQCKTMMKFSEYTQYWRNHIESSYPSSEPCLYLKDWHFTKDFPEENVYTVPQQFSSDWLNEYFMNNTELNDDYRFVYMGPKGSWTPFHADVFTSYSWSVNICGLKKWILLPPGEEEKMRINGQLPYSVNEKDCENFGAKYICIVQNPGDAIFVPSGWHHEVWNLMDTISINHNWINGCNIDKMWASMKRNLGEVKKEIFCFKSSMDNWREHCQLILKSCFGMDFKDFYNFLIFLLKNKKYLLETKRTQCVYGGWFIGPNHLNFDLIKIQNIIANFNDDDDVQKLLKEKNIKKFD